MVLKSQRLLEFINRRKRSLLFLLFLTSSVLISYYFLNLYFTNSVEYFQQKKYTIAEKRFEKIDALTGHFNLSAKEYLLAIYINQGKYTKAGPLAEQILDQNPANLVAIKSLSISLAGSKNLDLALNTLVAGINLQSDPAKIEDMGMLALTMITTNRNIESAIQWAVKIPKLLENLNLINEVLRLIEVTKQSSKSDLDLEISLREKYFSLAASEAANLIVLARLYKLKKEYSKVIYFYQEGLKINPDEASYLEEYADFLIEQNREIELAYKMYKKSLRLAPQNLVKIRQRLETKIQKLSFQRGSR